LLLLGVDGISNVRLKVAKRLHTVVVACDDDDDSNHDATLSTLL